MSYTVEVCIAHERTLSDLKAVVEKVLGVTFTRQDPTYQDFEGWLLGMHVSLGPNLLVSNGALNFSDFRYELGTRTGAGYRFNQRLRPLQLQMTDMMGFILCYHLGVEVLVTVDAQTFHARYKPEHVRGASTQDCDNRVCCENKRRATETSLQPSPTTSMEDNMLDKTRREWVDLLGIDGVAFPVWHKLACKDCGCAQERRRRPLAIQDRISA